MPEIRMTLHATTLWADTGLTLDGTAAVSIVATGQWTANPETGMVDANGNAAYEAKEGYNLPGHNEGLLVGKVTESGQPFALGANGTVQKGQVGELYVSINDDMFKQYGAGFPDNQGSLDLVITVG